MASSSGALGVAYQDILQLARRFARTDNDARDLAQDTMMIALDRGFDDWPSPTRRSWLRGVLRRHAAFVARSDVRRRRREQAVVETLDRGPSKWAWQPAFLSSLPCSLRAVATLASADLSAAEIRWLLDLSPAALRSRLSALRRAVRAEAELPTRASPASLESWGTRRAPVLAALKRQRGHAFATHDPDGHTILFSDSSSQSAGVRQ